jgi:putative salt-induced outer membrane protein YdiY
MHCDEGSRRLLLILIAAATGVAWTGMADAEEAETGWFDAAELSFVATAGNSDAVTLGFSNLLRRVWSAAELAIELGAVRSQSRDDRFGIGTVDDFRIVEPESTVDTERYFGKIKYSRTVSSRFFWFGSVDAERNVPANIEHRYTTTGGLGTVWIDSDRVTLRTSYGVNYTTEKLTVTGTNDFSGFRLGMSYENELVAGTTYTSDLTFDDNFEDLEDHRTDFLNAVTVNMTDELALKVSLRLLYRNLPALEQIDVFDGDPASGAATIVGNAETEKDELDTSFSTSLVVTF